MSRWTKQLTRSTLHILPLFIFVTTRTDLRTEARKAMGMKLTVEVNGCRELYYHEVRNNVYPLTLFDDEGIEIEIGCTIFQFEHE